MADPANRDRRKSSSWAAMIAALVACGVALACGGMTGDLDDAQGSGGSAGVGGTDGASGGSPGMTECSTSADCVVGYEGCCAPCEPTFAEDLAAYNGSWFANRPLCDIACAPCAEVEEVEREGQYFVAQCVTGHCALVDIREDYTECNTGEDCVLFEGTDCCQGCDGTGYIAVSSFEFQDGKCDTPVACPRCASVPPEGLSAQCGTESHCEVVQK